MNRDFVVVTGMVIQVMPISDFDKRLLILTTDRGKITVFVKGARRPNSPFVAVANPFVFGEFELIEGKNAYTLSKATINNYFRELVLEPSIACYGFYFLEVAEHMTRENNDEKNVLKLLYVTLRTVEKNTIDLGLIRRIFELKLFVIEGEYPNLFSCQSCGKEEELTFFSVRTNGLVCGSCSTKKNEREISDTLIYTMKYIITASLDKLYTFTLSKEVFFEFDQLMEEYLKNYLPYKFKSLEILKTMLS